MLSDNIKKLLVVFVVFAIAGLTYFVVRSAMPDDFIIVRVSSTDLNEQVEFETSYLVLSRNKPMRAESKQKTPFEIKVRGDYIVGTFFKKSGDAKLQVEVATSADGKIERKRGSDNGDLIILTTNDDAEEKYRFSLQALGASEK